jgi:hypothetical protein
LRVTFAALAVLPFAFACNDDPADEGDPAEAVVAMRLTVGSQTITINETGAVTGGPIVLPRGNTNIAAVFLDAANATVSGLDAEFRLEVTTDNASIAAFSRTSSFAGTLVGAAAGQTVLRFALFHVEENHEDFGFYPVPVTVQ